MISPFYREQERHVPIKIQMHVQIRDCLLNINPTVLMLLPLSSISFLELGSLNMVYTACDGTYPCKCANKRMNVFLWLFCINRGTDVQQILKQSKTIKTTNLNLSHKFYLLATICCLQIS